MRHLLEYWPYSLQSTYDPPKHTSLWVNETWAEDKGGWESHRFCFFCTSLSFSLCLSLSLSVSLSLTHTHTHTHTHTRINLDCMVVTFSVSLSPLHGNHPREWNWKGKSPSVQLFATPWTIQSISGLPVSPCSLWVLTRLHKNRSLWSLSFCLQYLLSVCKSGSWFRDHEI